MLKKNIYFFFLFLSFFSIAEIPPFNVEIGEPSYEFKSDQGINSYVLADTKKKTVLKRNYLEYYNLRDFKTKQRFFRVHVPITIIPNLVSPPKLVDIVYSFSFESIYKIDHSITKSVFKTPFKWDKIPLSTAGKTTWTITSDWMVQSDNNIWNNGDYIVETDSGNIKIVGKPANNVRWATPLVRMYFPFTISYWTEQNGFNGKWKNIAFPKLIYREINGNEIYSGCDVQVFSPKDNTPSCGSLKTKDLKKLFERLKKTWKNPYTNSFVFTNFWEQSAWAIKYKKIADNKLKAAFLSRILLTNPNDIDAAELLLKQLANLKESNKAGRIYVKCKNKWPQYNEHWFKIYLSSVKDTVTKRALLMSFLREHPNSSFALKELTFSLINADRLRSAKTLADKWKTIEPSNIFVYSAYAAIAEKSDNKNDLLNAYSAAIKYAIPTPTNKCLNVAGLDNYLKGCNSLTAGKYNDALRFFRKYLTFTNSASCHLKMGYAYLKMGLKAPALSSFKKAIKLSPDNPGVLVGLIDLYTKSKNLTAAKPYQIKLEKNLLPLIKNEFSKNNITNAIALAKYVLDAYPNSICVKEIFIRALIYLKLYDRASDELYKIHGNKSFARAEYFLWGELLTSLYYDKSVLLLSKNKIDLPKLAIEAWEKAGKLSPRNAIPPLEQALLYFANKNYQQAYLALKKCYKKNKSPALAVWIADTCLLIAEKTPYKTLPDNSTKTFAAEAIAFYSKANEFSDMSFYSPNVAIGLYHAAKLIAKSNTDYNSYLRKGLKAFPASPELRAAQINAFVEAGATAPALWVPFTNTFINLRSSSYNVITCLETLFKMRNIPFNKLLMRDALNLVFFSKYFYGNINNQQETAGKRKIFSIEKQSGFRFILKKHIFLQPASAYEWFSFRSKYTSADLKTGKTLWWEKHLILSKAYKKLTAAFNNSDNKTGDVAIADAALRRDLGFNYMLDETDPAAAYSHILKRIYYLPVSLKPKTHSHGYYNSHYHILFKKDINVPPIYDLVKDFSPPVANSGFNALPPELRKFYYKRNVTDRILPRFLRKLLPQNKKLLNFSFVYVDDFSLPDNNDFKITFEDKNLRRHSSTDFSDKGLIVRQSIDNSAVTNTEKFFIIIPLLSKNEIPVFKSFFNKKLKFKINGINIASTKIVDCNQPIMSFVLSPALMNVTPYEYNDECLTIEIRWKNLTNAVLKVFAKTYSVENGFKYNDPGIPLLKKDIISPVSIGVKIDNKKITLNISDNDADNKTELSAFHHLSEFVWRNKVFYSIQTKTCPYQIEYKMAR